MILLRYFETTMESAAFITLTKKKNKTEELPVHISNVEVDLTLLYERKVRNIENFFQRRHDGNC